MNRIWRYNCHANEIQIQTICSRVTGILILIDSLGCLKEVKTMNMILEKCKFQNSFLPFFSYML